MFKAQKIACFVSIVLLLTIMLSIVLFAMSITSAEETTDKYVVFNQQVSNGNFANGTSGYSFNGLSGSVADGVYTCKPTSIPSVDYACLISFSVNYVNSHKYFVRLDCKSSKSNSYFTLTNNQGVDFYQTISSSMSTYSGIFTSSKTGSFNTLLYSSFSKYSTSDTFSVSNINIIDLTQMFGVGNEPTIDVCRNLFVSAYYPYNVDGSVISIDGFSNYSQGVLDTNKSYSTTLTYSTLSRNAFLYDNLGADELNRIDYTDDNKLPVWGVVGLPLNSVVRAGNTITVSCSFAEVVVGSNTVLVNLAYLYNNTLVPCGVLITAEDDYLTLATISNATCSFTLPYDVDTLFIYCSFSPSQKPDIDPLGYISDLRISFASFDNSILLSNSWNSGFDYGYDSGYTKGYNKGLAIGSDKQYSFAGLLDAVVQAPITALIGSYDSSGKRVGGLLNFEFLGVNLSFFFTGLLSVTLVIVVIRFILARK